MDPNEALNRLRFDRMAASAALSRFHLACEGDSDDDEHLAAVGLEGALTELMGSSQDLDVWLSGEGFPPDAWAARERKLTMQNDRMAALLREIADTTINSDVRVLDLIVGKARNLLMTL